MIFSPWHFWRWCRVLIENRAYRTTDDAALLSRLNEAWATATKDVSHWRTLVEDETCPPAFTCWDEYRARMPVMVKRSVADNPTNYFSCYLGKGTTWSKTGGTIAQPLRFPVGKNEAARIIKNEWIIRHWAGISPFSRQFKIWGHSHIFAGANAKSIYRTRRLKDALLGMVRLSAYDLSEDRLAEIGNRLGATSCDFVMSYSRCLETVAAALAARGVQISSSIKAVIATSECFTNDEAEGRVAKAFNAPVFMEYGSAETGPIALRGPDGSYAVAWREFWLEAIPTDTGAHRLLITTLGCRKFPLFRYEIGDFVLNPDTTAGVKKFGMVQGRLNEVIILANGRQIHSQAITHAIDGLPGLRQFQFVVSGDGAVSLRVDGDFTAENSGQKISWMRHNLGQLDPLLANAEILVNQGLKTTAAGKRPLVFREPKTS